MRLFFGGAEINTHRSLLQEMGVKNVSMSYMGLRRRVKFSKPWKIEDRFDKDTAVFLDSGAYTINSDADADPDEIIDIAAHYREFVLQNLDRIDLVSEFDALALGVDWVEEQRDQFWSQAIPREKFMAVWHPVWGIPYLHEMASMYEVIGIPATSMEGRNLRPILNSLAAKGVRLHGVAMTKIEEMQSIRWDSVASTSWISPQRFGDTIVWTGNALKRYPKKYKDRARKQHRTLFTQKGFDAAKISDDDPTEVLRLSIWSWQQFEAYVNKHQGVTPLFSHRTGENGENPDEPVDTQAEDAGEDVPTEEPKETPSRVPVKRREPSAILPVMGITTHKENEEDEDEEGQPILNVRSESARVCNSCFLAEKCPAYEPDSNCAYNIPITVRTREQFRALNYGMLEMQAQRVMFMRFAEEMEGGYADPNLSKEIGLLNKMSAQIAEMEREGFSINLSVKGSQQAAESGMISRLFGPKAGQQVQQIEAGPVIADEYIDVEFKEENE